MKRISFWFLNGKSILGCDYAYLAEAFGGHTVAFARQFAAFITCSNCHVIKRKKMCYSLCLCGNVNDFRLLAAVFFPRLYGGMAAFNNRKNSSPLTMFYLFQTEWKVSRPPGPRHLARKDQQVTLSIPTESHYHDVHRLNTKCCFKEI